MDAKSWPTVTDWVELWHAIPWTDRMDRKRRLIANSVCRRFSSLLTDPRLVRVLDMSDDRADGLLQGKAWDEWERACSEVSRLETQARRALAQAVARTIEELRTDDHKVGRSIEIGVDVFGYLAAIKKRLMRPGSRVQTGRKLWAHPVFIAGRDEDGSRIVCEVIREVVWNPFRSMKFSKQWRTDTAVALARQMYDSRDFSAMPILADALQDAGCENADILEHCRGSGPHACGCWVVDLVLGKS